MSEQQITTGREGRERDAGYTPLTDAAAPAAEPKTYPAGEEGARQAANDVTAARGGPSELPIIERPYVNPQTGEKIRTKFSVTPEKAGRDLSERHRVEATERQTDADINLAVSVLEARDRVAA